MNKKRDGASFFNRRRAGPREPANAATRVFAYAVTRRQAALGLMAAAGIEAGCAGSRQGQRRVHVVMNFSAGSAAAQAPAEAEPAGDRPALIHTAVDEGLRMTAPVFIDRKGPFTFIVDTGANVSVFAIEAAAGMGLPAGPLTAVHGIAGLQSAPTVKIDRLSIGAVASSRLVMPLMGAEALGADGLLGVDVLKNRLVQLDFKNRRLSIGPSRQAPGALLREATRIGSTGADDTMVVVPARYRFGQLTVVDADVGGLPVTAFLDSGSEATVGNLALFDGFGRRRSDLVRLSRSVELISATGQTATGQMAPMPALRLGGLKLGNLRAVFSDLHAFEIWGLADRPAILIGMDILRNFSLVELDFGRRQVRFHISGSAMALGAGHARGAPPS